MRLAVLDLVGTIVLDDGVVLEGIRRGLRAVRVPVEGPRFPALRRQAEAAMDRPTLQIFGDLLDGDMHRARRAVRAFEAYVTVAARAGRMPGTPRAREAVQALCEAGLHVAVVCGLEPSTRETVIAALGWEGVSCLRLSPPDTGGLGVPAPDPVLLAAARSDVDPAQVVVVGDSTATMAAALKAAAGLAVGVRNGAHSERALRAAGAHDVVDSLADLPALLGLPQLAA